MPTPIINIYEPNLNDSLEKRVKDLTNAYIDVMQQIRYLLGTLDSKNVKRLATEFTKISSDRGETTFDGPLITMRDKQTTPVVRLQMGYDPASGLFVFKMYNTAGDTTVSLDSNGDQIVERGTFKGSITIGTGDNVFKADSNGIYLGDAVFADAPFKVAMNGSSTASNLTITGGTITIGIGDNVFKVDANGIYLGDATYADAPFKVSMAGAAEASNLDITGGSISVDTDAYVGNNIFIGTPTSFASKGLYFYDEEGTTKSIGIFLNEYEPDAFELLMKNEFRRVNICSDYEILLGSEAAGSLLAVNANDGYFTLTSGSDTYDSQVYMFGAADLHLQHQGSGALWLDHVGDGVLKIESINNMSIESTDGEIYIIGTIRASSTLYIGLPDENNRVLKKSEIEGMIPSLPSGFTGTRVIDGETYTWSNGILTSVV